MNTNNNKETPNYGEPWKIENSETEIWVSATNWTRDPGDIACEMGDDNTVSLKHWPARAERIVQCVNACAGMADPAAEIAEMRRDLNEIQASYAEMCARLQECVQKHQIGLGGEKLDQLVCDEITAMREAIKEAHEVLSELRGYPIERGYVDSPCLKNEDMIEVKAALIKLQPFIK